jgi:hypothetical protein
MWEDEVRIPPPGYRSGPQRRAAEARRMVLAVGGVGAVLLLCAVGYVAATRTGSESVPVIQAPTGSLKVKPDNPGGMQVNAQTSVLLGRNGSGAGANLAPAPEVPDPAALAAAANQEQAPSTSIVTAASPPPAAPSTPTPVIVPNVPETPAPFAPHPTATTIPPPSAGAAAVHNLSQELNPPVRAADHGHVRVQLAALDSQAAALHEWDRLTHRMPTLFNGRHPIFAEAHVNGHTFWRVRTAGFGSLDEAARFCTDVRAQGAACTVALF